MTNVGFVTTLQAGLRNCHVSKIYWTDDELEIRYVERGICPTATSTMNELFL